MDNGNLSATARMMIESFVDKFTHTLYERISLMWRDAILEKQQDEKKSIGYRRFSDQSILQLFLMGMEYVPYWMDRSPSIIQEETKAILAHHPKLKKIVKNIIIIHLRLIANCQQNKNRSIGGKIPGLKQIIYDLIKMSCKSLLAAIDPADFIIFHWDHCPVQNVKKMDIPIAKIRREIEQCISDAIRRTLNQYTNIYKIISKSSTSTKNQKQKRKKRPNKSNNENRVKHNDNENRVKHNDNENRVKHNDNENRIKHNDNENRIKNFSTLTSIENEKNERNINRSKSDEISKLIHDKIDYCTDTSEIEDEYLDLDSFKNSTSEDCETVDKELINTNTKSEAIALDIGPTNIYTDTNINSRLSVNVIKSDEDDFLEEVEEVEEYKSRSVDDRHVFNLISNDMDGNENTKSNTAIFDTYESGICSSVVNIEINNKRPIKNNDISPEEEEVKTRISSNKETNNVPNQKLKSHLTWLFLDNKPQSVVRINGEDVQNEWISSQLLNFEK
jgi:hypothetical protein